MSMSLRSYTRGITLCKIETLRHRPFQYPLPLKSIPNRKKFVNEIITQNELQIYLQYHVPSYTLNFSLRQLKCLRKSYLLTDFRLDKSHESRRKSLFDD